MEPIYLDHNATTPVDPAVVEAMLPHLTHGFGNASSVHQFGRTARVALENARELIAAFINCEPSELLFTSGGTESDNLAVMGIASSLQKTRNHLIVGSTEHHAVLESAEFLHRTRGFELALLPVDREGIHDPQALRSAVTDKTSIVSIMHSNNETGALQDIAALASAAHERGALFHTDAVQSVGKVPVDAKALDVDLLSLTGHKIYGPKGTGALFIRQGIRLTPLFYGGSHEKKRRPGTENVAGAVGLAKALETAGARRQQDYQRLVDLTDYLVNGLLSRIPDASLNGPRTGRLPQTANISFKGIPGEPIILSLDMEGVAVASGSACTSGATEPSHVLSAMGVPRDLALGAIRFSLGRSTTREMIDRVLSLVPPIVERLRAMSPSHQPSRA